MRVSCVFFYFLFFLRACERAGERAKKHTREHEYMGLGLGLKFNQTNHDETNRASCFDIVCSGNIIRDTFHHLETTKTFVWHWGIFWEFSQIPEEVRTSIRSCLKRL